MPTHRSHPFFALAVATGLVVAGLGLCGSAELLALPPPTMLDVPVDGGRPHIKGEKPPPPGRSLDAPAPAPKLAPKPAPKLAPKLAPKPAPKLAPKPKPAPKPAPKLAPKPAPKPAAGPLTLRRKPRRRTADRKTIIVMLDTGRLSVPRAIVQLASGYDSFPAIVATGFDLTVMRAANARHSYGVRLGIAVPAFPAANWYNDNAPAKAMHHDVQLTFIDVAFEYAYRRRLFGPVGFQLRFGAGIDLAIGDVTRVEVLPNCQAPIDRCPHWRDVGRHGSSLPSPIWPALRASGGLFVELGQSLGLHVDAGLRGALYLGAGVSFRR